MKKNHKLLIVAVAFILISGAIFIHPKTSNDVFEDYSESTKIYSTLPEEEKKLYTEENIQDKREEHIKEFEDKIYNEYPNLEDIKESDKTIIDEGSELYEKLTDEEKIAIRPEILEKYEQAIDSYYHTAPTLEVIGDTFNRKASDIVEIVASGIPGIEGVYISADDGATWKHITDYDSIAYEIIRNGTYEIKAIDKVGNETIKTITYFNLDPIRPVIKLDSNDYKLGSWTNKPVVLTARNIANNSSPVTIFVSTDRENWTIYSEAIIHNEDTGATGATYYFKAASDAGLESEIIEGNIKKDSISPTGTLEFAENSLNSFLNTITFGLFFKETKEIKLLSDDDISNVSKTEYLIPEETESPLVAASTSEWIKFDNSISVNPEKYSSLLFRITDKAGNFSIISTDGDVISVTSPAIEGYAANQTYSLEENQIYHLTQKLIINNDREIKAITINGEPAELNNGVITIPEESNTEKRISITDKTGDEFNLVIGRTEIPSLDDINFEHVNKNNIEEITNVTSKLEGILYDQNIDLAEGESVIIVNLINKFGEVLEKIEGIEEKIKEIENSYLEILTIETITSDQKAKIEESIDGIENIFGYDKSHLTNEENEELENIAKDFYEKRNLINENAKKLDEIKTRSDEYDIETITSNDEKNLEELKYEIEEFEAEPNLTYAEKEELRIEEEKIDKLQEHLKEVKRKIEEISANNVKDINKENVTKEDQVTLENAATSYTEALGVFESNLSLSEIFSTNNAMATINSALNTLDQVSEFEAIVSSLPNQKDVNYSSRESIKTAQAAYSNLSEYAKTLVGPSLMLKYKATLSAYKVFLENSPIFAVLETPDVLWWIVTALFIASAFVITIRRTHKHYSDIEDSDDF